MKAVIITEVGGPEVLTLGEWPMPDISDTEVLVKVHATAINRADTLQRRGKYPVPQGESPILGLEMAGEVVKCGPKVKELKVGDRVCGLLGGGGHAEYATIEEDLCMILPSNMTYEEAAAIPEVFLTAHQALFWLGKLEKGQKILIHAAASGVGTAATQLAKVIETEVFATASRGKHDICRKMGADHLIDYQTEDFLTIVMQESQKKGVNMILDFVAAPYFQKNLDCLAVDGVLVMLALLGGVKAGEVNLAPILRKRLQIKGSTLRSRSLKYKTDLTRDFVNKFWSHFEQKSLQAVIDRVMSWEEISEAHRIMEANQNAGKIVLKVG
jgi:tumor protein p53-inducible protein 3